MLTTRILAVGLLIDAIERLISLERWASELLRFHIPKVVTARHRTRKAVLLLLVLVQISAAVAMLIGVAVIPALLASIVLIVIYTKGDIYGLMAADGLAITILLGLLAIQSSDSHLVEWVAVGFIIANVLLAYFCTGFFKVIAPLWRNGDAIALPLRTTLVGHPQAALMLGKYRWLRLGICWATIGLELAMPLVILVPQPFVPVFLGAGFLFHLCVAYFMRLGLFFWVFLSAYPLIYVMNGAISPW